MTRIEINPADIPPLRFERGTNQVVRVTALDVESIPGGGGQVLVIAHIAGGAIPPTAFHLPREQALELADALRDAAQETE